MTGIRGFKAAKTSPSSFLRRQESLFNSEAAYRIFQNSIPLRCESAIPACAGMTTSGFFEVP